MFKWLIGGGEPLPADWEEQAEERKRKQAECPHETGFYVSGGNTVWTCTCKACGGEVGMDDALNFYFRKMEALIERVDGK